MAKFYFEMKFKGAIDLRVYEIDEDTYNDLEDDDEWEDNGLDIIENFSEVASAIVMYNDKLYDSENFSLVVKDEEGNVVYETEDASSIPMYCYFPYSNSICKYYDDEEGEDGDDKEYDLPNFKFEDIADGFYMIENNNLRWTYFEGEFETDNFDPSKFAFYPSEYFDDIICEDDVFISNIRYDGKPIEFEEDGSDPYGSNFKLLTKDEDGWSDHH